MTDDWEWFARCECPVSPCVHDLAAAAQVPDDPDHFYEPED